MSMKEAETIIVGGGPAGSACARVLAGKGRDVLVLDKTTFPREKPCAGWVAGEIWEALGVAPEEYPYPLTRVHRLSVAWNRLSFTLPVRLLAVRRREFDHWLLSTSGAGVETHRVEQIREEGDGYVIDDQYRCRYLVGAGGTNCPVAKSLFKGIHPRASSSLIVAIAEEVPASLCWPRVETPDESSAPIDLPADSNPFTPSEPFRSSAADKNQLADSNPSAPCRLWFFFEGLPGYAWYLPKSGGTVNIGIGGKALAIRKDGRTLLEYWHRFLHHLEKIELLDPAVVKDSPVWDRPASHGYYLWEDRRVLQKGNAFLVGDAAGLATADMGEGIANAVRSGILAARAITEDIPLPPKVEPSFTFMSRPRGSRSRGSRPFGLRQWSEPWPVSWIIHRKYR
ncbi:MAG: geranylgeranyl reductase family protein [Spirochaetales bacterium]